MHLDRYDPNGNHDRVTTRLCCAQGAAFTICFIINIVFWLFLQCLTSKSFNVAVRESSFNTEKGEGGGGGL